MKKSLITIVLIIGAVGIILSQSKIETPPIIIEEEINLVPEVVAENLYVPWSILRLPDGRLLVAERRGTLQFIGETQTSINVPGVSESGEGGLMGVALHPDFINNKFIYLYFTTRTGADITNKVVRYVLDGDILTEDMIIIDYIPGGPTHNGGRIAFGPDGLLYITTGDAGDSNLAQSLKSFAGKILRLHDDGVIPLDNPFDSQIYSYGHRNPQGLTWDSEGRLWLNEHGRSGVVSGLDEINLIIKGGNYGWPEIQGSDVKEGMITPTLHSGSTITWAPADLVFHNDKLYFTGLRGSTLYEVSILPDGTLAEATEYFKNEYGRLRALYLDIDGSLYFGTSNKDGRGRPKAGDDKILKIKF